MVNFKNLRKMIEVKGNGNIVSRELSVSTFIRLHIGCSGIVELHQSDVEKVTVEADENLLEYFAAGNAGRTLYVSNEGNLRKPAFTSCVVRVYFRQFDKLIIRNQHGTLTCPAQLVLQDPLEIKIQSVGDTELNLSAPSVKMVSQTVGNVTIKGRCEKLEIKNQSTGNLDASQMEAGDLSISNMAHGNVQLHANNTIRMSHYGNGFIHYSGDANVKDVKQYGNGEIKHIVLAT